MEVLCTFSLRAVSTGIFVNNFGRVEGFAYLGMTLRFLHHFSWLDLALHCFLSPSKFNVYIVDKRLLDSLAVSQFNIR